MRWERYADMDAWASGEAPFRSERVRELVDALTGLEREVIERCFFGGDYLNTVARDCGVSKETAKNARTAALARLRAALSETDPVGSVSTDNEPDVP